MFRGMDDEVFRALADPNRRTLLDRLFERDGQALGELEAALPGMTRFGVMKHLRVLEAARLVTSRKVGRERHHYLNPVPIRRIHDRWLDRYRARAADLLDDLRITLEAEPMTAPDLAAAAPPKFVFATFIRATPETIWRALTETDFTLRYYYGNAIESTFEPGAPYRMTADGELQIEGEILEADRPHRLVQSWHGVWDEAMVADAPSRVTWEIEEAMPGVCRLTLVHEGLVAGSATLDQVSGGWPYILSGLKTLLETGKGLGEG